jgi:hypothetical protein
MLSASITAPFPYSMCVSEYGAILTHDYSLRIWSEVNYPRLKSKDSSPTLLKWIGLLEYQS